jgi:tryptophan synthase beta chain
VVKEAIKAREAGQKRVLLFNLSGHGLLDLSAYETYQTGRMSDV